MARVGFLGAFSIDNAGDVLVGLAGRQALRAVVPGLEERIFAPALPTFAHDVSDGVTLVPAGEDMSWAQDLDALVIGGGGVIETDPAFRPFLLGRPERWPAEIPAAWNAVCSQNQAWYAAGLDDAYRAVA